MTKDAPVDYSNFEIRNGDADRLQGRYVTVPNEEMAEHQRTTPATKPTDWSGRDSSSADDSSSRKPFTTIPEFALASLELFDTLDVDSDGTLSKAEIVKATQNPAYVLGDAQVVGGLYLNYYALVGRSDDQLLPDTEISKNDIRTLIDEAPPPNLPYQVSDGAVKATRSAVPEAQYVYATPENSIASISPHAIRQGTLGDCSFLSVVAGIAETNPQAIEKMIRQNQDGTYTVTFPGDADHPVTVSAPTPTEMVLFNPAGKHGSWVTILEKAYGQYRNETEKNDLGGILERAVDWVNSDNQLPSEGAATGVPIAKNVELLTGNKSEFLSTGLESRDLADVLDHTLNGAIPGAVAAQVFDRKTPMNFPANHAYSIIGFERNGDGGILTIRNPWGLGSNTPEGVIHVTMADFRKNFDAVVLERPYEPLDGSGFIVARK